MHSVINHLNPIYCLAVQFKLNSAALAISEGGDLPSQLSILKMGQNEADISFPVLVIPGTAEEDTGT